MSGAKIGSSERGAVLVEMAFALPLLALVFLCIVDLGIIVREYQLVQNAAREGARFSSLPINQIVMADDPAATTAAIKQFVVQYAAQENISIDPNDVAINQFYGVSTACGSEITVTYTRSMLLLGVPFLPSNTITLTGRSVFHNLYGC